MHRTHVIAMLACAVVATSCGGPTKMGGFSEQDAKARAPKTELIDSCNVRSGKLVIELERVLVNEYPHYGADPERRREQPMVLSLLDPPGAQPDPHKVEMAAIIAPAAYKPGEEVVFFKGRRILERTVRSLQGYRLTLKLAENDRTESPAWAAVTSKATGASGAVSLAGLPNPSSALREIVEVVRKIDRDDLILQWGLDLGDLIRQLGTRSERKLIRLSTQSSRTITAGAHAGLPAAEMALLIYMEPEPDCGAM